MEMGGEILRNMLLGTPLLLGTFIQIAQFDSIPLPC